MPFFIHKFWKAVTVKSAIPKAEKTVLKNRGIGRNIAMTREMAKTNLIACGIETPTDEQITAYLNQLNGAVKNEKDRADRLKTEADKVASLQAQLDELNNKGLTEVEKANKATESALARVAELEKNLKAMEVKEKLATLGIIGDDAKNLIGENGELNFDTLGQVISAREKKAAADKEAELAGNAGNPGGNGGSNGGEDVKDQGAIMAERYNAQYSQNGG